MLPGNMVRGSTVPVKRSTSTFWFTPICFSPTTIKCPLGNTSETVAVMVPVKVLALVVPPLPEKSNAEDAVSPETLSAAFRMASNGTPVTLPELLEVRAAVEVDTWLADTASTI